MQTRRSAEVQRAVSAFSSLLFSSLLFSSLLFSCRTLLSLAANVVVGHPEANMKTEGSLWVFTGLVILSLVVRYVIGLKDVLGRTLPRRHSPRMTQLLRGVKTDQGTQGSRDHPSDSEDNVCQCLRGKRRQRQSEQ